MFGSNGVVGKHILPNTRGPCVIVGRKGSFGKVNFSTAPVFAIDTTYFVDERFSSGNIRWLYYVLFWLRLDQITKDAAVPGLSREDAYKETAPYPPLPEQTAIARFLDHMDRRIQKYIRAKEKLIALLDEYKQALIHQAVTGQIDVRTGQPYKEYKESGVEWFGSVPAHWEVTRVKAVLSNSIQNGLFKKKDQFGAGVPFVNVADVYTLDHRIEPPALDRVICSEGELRRFRVESGDLFFVRSSLKLEGTGRSAIAINCPPDTVYDCHLVRARPNATRANARYLVRQLNAHAVVNWLISHANVVTMATVAQDTIACCPILNPPLAEQDSIVEWIDSWSEALRVAIANSKKEVLRVEEYRTRLIADVVTGKLDVREAAASLRETDSPVAEPGEA